jgi:microcompartment protein CcmK/EutM
MNVGLVVGTVVATKKEEELGGLKFLLVRGIDLDGKPTSTQVVAADAVGAGLGEVVLYASGSSARQTRVTKDRPVDATIMAIVDTIEVNGQVKFDKRKA